MDYYMIISTIDNKEIGIDMAKNLINKNLAACVNIIDQITSVYKWKGKMETINEYMLLIKTTADKKQKTIEKIKTLHPYELPEIISFKIEGGDEEYLKWVNEISGGKK